MRRSNLGGATTCPPSHSVHLQQFFQLQCWSRGSASAPRSRGREFKPTRSKANIFGHLQQPSVRHRQIKLHVYMYNRSSVYLWLQMFNALVAIDVIVQCTCGSRWSMCLWLQMFNVLVLALDVQCTCGSRCSMCLWFQMFNVLVARDVQCTCGFICSMCLLLQMFNVLFFFQLFNVLLVALNVQCTCCFRCSMCLQLYSCSVCLWFWMFNVLIVAVYVQCTCCSRCSMCF